MIHSAPELKAAIERAARDNPAGRNVFEIGEDLEGVGVRDLPITGWTEIVGGSIRGMNVRNCGAMILRGVRIFGQQASETWGPRAIQFRFSGDANLMFDGCTFEAEGAPWTRPDGVIVDHARRVRFQNCDVRGLFNGFSVASAPVIEVLGCDFRQMIGDSIALRNVNPALAPRVQFTARDNLIMAAHEAERVHPDAIQLTSAVPLTVDIARNALWTPGRSFQGVFTHTPPGSDAPIMGRIVQNAMLIRHPNAIYAWRPGGLHVAANMIATECSRDPGNSAARIFARVSGMSAAGNVTYRLAGPIHDAGGNVAIPRGAYAGRLRGPWKAGEWGDVLASPPPLDAPANVVKGALRRALTPI